MADPNVNLSNSNHSTGPSSSSAAAANATGDHKIAPAAIGSERKRHMPMATGATGDWSSVSKRTPSIFYSIASCFFLSFFLLATYTIDPYVHQQQQARDYTRERHA